MAIVQRRSRPVKGSVFAVVLGELLAFAASVELVGVVASFEGEVPVDGVVLSFDGELSFVGVVGVVDDVDLVGVVEGVLGVWL